MSGFSEAFFFNNNNVNAISHQNVLIAFGNKATLYTLHLGHFFELGYLFNSVLWSANKEFSINHYHQNFVYF